MMKQHRLIRIVSGFFWSLGWLLLFGGAYYHAAYTTGFQELLYSLFSPIKGTAAGAMGDGLLRVGLPTLLMIALFVLLMLLLRRAWAVRPLLRRIVLLSGIAVLVTACAVVNRQLGVTDYIHRRMHPSRLYEERYVDPRSVRVTAPQRKKNLIVLYVESLETAYASREHGGLQAEELMPNLYELAQSNISFGQGAGLRGFRSLAGTNWTMAAMLASTSGVHFGFPVDGNQMNRYQRFAPGLTALGDLLAADGYRQSFLCGSDADFAGRRGYLEQHGQYEILDLFTAREKGQIPKDYFTWWGYEDEKLFAIAKEELTRVAGSGGPFNFTLLTADLHHPGGYVSAHCPRTHDNPTADVVLYSDAQIAAFVSWCQAQSFWDNTVMLILGDHPRMDPSLVGESPYNERPVYNCLLNTGMTANQNRLCSTMDLFPTTLAALGYTIEGDRLGLGVNLFADVPTLAESMGVDALQEELQHYARYFVQVFTKPAANPR